MEDHSRFSDRDPEGAIANLEGDRGAGANVRYRRFERAGSDEIFLAGRPTRSFRAECVGERPESQCVERSEAGEMPAREVLRFLEGRSRQRVPRACRLRGDRLECGHPLAIRKIGARLESAVQANVFPPGVTENEALGDSGWRRGCVVDERPRLRGQVEPMGRRGLSEECQLIDDAPLPKGCREARDSLPDPFDPPRRIQFLVGSGAIEHRRARGEEDAVYRSADVAPEEVELARVVSRPRASPSRQIRVAASISPRSSRDRISSAA